MNQIVFIEKKRKSGATDISKTAKISAIIMIVFGIFAIGRGVMGMITHSNEAQLKEPTVSVKETVDGLELKIEHDKAIDKIEYGWNDGEKTTLQGMGRTSIVETIDLPTGNNVLSIEITDIAKKTANYTKSYYKSADEDTMEPVIEFIVEGSKVKIVAKDDKELVSMNYYWNDEDPTLVEAREDSKKQIEERIAILKGENTLTVEAFDAKGNVGTKSQTYRGAKKPTINITKEGNEVVIKVSDEENIQKIELNMNGEFLSTDSANTGESLNMKEAEVRRVLKEGDNVITVTAYNVNKLSEQVTETITL